jgi:hypothetical protein
VVFVEGAERQKEIRGGKGYKCRSERNAEKHLDHSDND